MNSQRITSSAPVEAIGYQTCRNAQRAVLHALAEVHGDLSAAHEVLEVIGLDFKVTGDDDDSGNDETTHLRNNGGATDVFQHLEPRAWQKRASQ